MKENMPANLNLVLTKISQHFGVTEEEMKNFEFFRTRLRNLTVAAEKSNSCKLVVDAE
jgi:hypothetical protein